MNTETTFREAESLEDFYERELEWLRTMARGGSELAPAAALFYCNKHKISVPDWVVQAASAGYCKALSKSRAKKRGRSSEPVERCRQDMIDYVRWEAVQDVRERQRQFAGELRELSLRPGIPKSAIEQMRKKLKRAGRSWSDAYAVAATFQLGTPAFGSSAAMKASYHRVKNNSKIGNLRYRFLEADFLSSIGIEHPMFWKPVRK
jgi:hypothetical protein